MFLNMRRGAGLLLVGLGVCGCFPTAESQLDEQKNPYYLAGKERVASRDYSGAVEAFEKALEVNPRSALAHFELGVLFEQRENDYPAAIYHYNKVLQLRPSGDYPAEHAKLRIPACKQEMVKTDTLTTINPAALLELERLREENQQLRKQVEYLQAQLQSRPALPTAPSAAAAPQTQVASPGTRPPSVPSRASQTNLTRSPGPGAPRPPASSGTASASNFRTHKVRAKDTPASIARQYGVSLDALMTANPGLDAKKLQIGQTLKVPSS